MRADTLFFLGLACQYLEENAFEVNPETRKGFRNRDTASPSDDPCGRRGVEVGSECTEVVGN